VFVDGYALMALEEVAMTLAAPSAIGGVASTLFFGQRGINMFTTAKSGGCSLRASREFCAICGGTANYPHFSAWASLPHERACTLVTFVLGTHHC